MKTRLTLLAVLFGLHIAHAQQHKTYSVYNNQPELSASGSVTLLPPAGSGLRIFIQDDCGPLLSTPSNNQNYVLTRTFRVPGVNAQNLNDARTLCQENQVIQYLDGLGRPLQTVQVGASPSYRDIVVPVAYDALGREAIKYQPYAAGGTSGSYRATSIADQLAFYNGQPSGSSIQQTTSPFSVTMFEPSPLNRVERQGFPGAAWQPGTVGTEHTARLSYGANNNDINYGTTGLAVRLFSADMVATAGHEHERTLSSSGFYGAGQLYLTISRDENWQASDGKKGTVEEYKDKEGRIVLKRMFNEKAGNIEVLSTYYVYDDLGNLSFVLPPGASPDAGVPNGTTMEQFCYQYRYDGRKRLIEKKLPGKGWEHMVYNKLDQLVLSQDANQRAGGQWHFTKYDALGRSVMTGIFSSTGNRAYLDSVMRTQVHLWEVREANNGTAYTNNAFPTDNIARSLTFSYYDDYDFRNMYATLPPSIGASGMIKGLPTGTRTFRDDGTASEWTMLYYDDYGRVWETVSTHHLGGTDRVVNSYNFDGSVKGTTRTHVNGSATTTIANSYKYDHMGRRTHSYQRTYGSPQVTGTEVLLSKMDYDEIGQLKAKKLHDSLQVTNYAYNERGWLKSSSSPQFSIGLQYNDGTYPQYNGNISGQSFTNNGSNAFTYQYDRLNRLTNGTATGMSEILDYDVMGNITSLNRDGTGARAYSYSGNRLLGIPGFTNTYVYDANGNATTDGRNDMYLAYNHLNLPITANKSGLNMAYTYDATGAKLKKVSTRASTVTTDYIGGIQYTNGTIDFIQTGEGIARNNGGTYSYEYNLSDHLGNVRATFKVNGSTIEVLQRDDYYAFGLRKSVNNDIGAVSLENKYLYNGKELQEELEQYDYGARLYDPVIGRWNVVDKKSELYFHITPYAYAANTPTNAIDPDGNLVIFINGQHGGDGGSSEYWRNGGKEKNIHFDVAFKKHFSDDRAMYLDGALGGWDNTLAPKGKSFQSNLNAEDRIAMGQAAGMNGAGDIIRSLKRTNGVITESIKIVAHSMGAAYAKGFIAEIVQYAKDHPEECRGLSITEYDFAAFQQNKLSAIPGVPLYQFDNRGDIVVNSLFTIKLDSWFATEEGATKHEKDTNKKGGHSIFDFFDVINTLSEGNYKFIDNQFVKQN